MTQFGQPDKAMPSHGVARTATWKLAEEQAPEVDGHVKVCGVRARRQPHHDSSPGERKASEVMEVSRGCLRTSRDFWWASTFLPRNSPPKWRSQRKEKHSVMPFDPSSIFSLGFF